MKTLSLARPLMLILVGLPGSGKSFFARQFAEMFNAPNISYDRLRFELFDKPKHTSEEQELIMRVADYQIGELLKTHRSFVVDGGCNSRADRQKLETLAKASGYGTLVIWVQTDEITCRQRATKRSTKRTDDKYSPSITESQWATMAKRLNQPNKEDYMVISGKHAFSTQAKMVLRKLTTPHVQEAETAHQQEREQAIRVELPKSRPSPDVPQRRNVLIR